ncbi:hypothetical protein ZWY2020_006164 [Hordeum vulgare]|nr:hypothetical protein ZWY2020_006164 [Hordeum vulgare]
MATIDDSRGSTTGAARRGADRDTAVQKSGGWFGFIFDAMEVMLKIMKDGLSNSCVVHLWICHHSAHHHREG